MGLTSVGRVRLAEMTYVFIDGGYLRKVYAAAMCEFFGSGGDLDFTQLKNGVGAKRAFYYDCLDDIQRDGESREDSQGRIAQQEEFFDGLRALEGYHVRLGTLSGAGKRPRQKEVDVLLAVDMLNHAVGGNMTEAVLVTGDRDFKPVVESLVQLGTYIRVYYERSSAAKELWQAADGAVDMTLSVLHPWSSQRFRTRNPIPYATGGSQIPEAGFRPIKSGLHKNRAVKLLERNNEYLIFAEATDEQMSIAMKWKDQAKLEQFFIRHFGMIQWE